MGSSTRAFLPAKRSRIKLGGNPAIHRVTFVLVQNQSDLVKLFFFYIVPPPPEFSPFPPPPPLPIGGGGRARIGSAHPVVLRSADRRRAPARAVRLPCRARAESVARRASPDPAPARLTQLAPDM